MNKYFLLFGLVISLLISACNSDAEEKEETDIQTQTPVTSTISQNTSLVSDENLVVKINFPTAVCSSCEKTIKQAVEKIDGVEKVMVDADKKSAEVEFNGAKTTADEIRTAIANSGYDADNIKRNSAAYEKLDECCKTNVKSEG